MWLRFLLLCASILGLGCCGDLGEREGIQRIDITEGETLTLTCLGRPTHLRSYRWVYIRKGTRKPRVLSSGRRLVLGEPRLSIEAFPAGDHVRLVLKMTEIRPYEAGLFMCWRQGLKPDPQVYVRVLEAGVTEAEPLSIEISSPSHVDYGGAVTINCLIRPSWPGKVEWLRNGTIISPSDRVYTQQVEERPGGELVASLKAASIRQGANYSCRVPSSPAVEASLNLAVRVARIESLASEPSKDAIEYGEMFSIICTVSGTDHKILWLKDGENLELKPDDTRRRKWDEILSDGNMKSTLHIEAFSAGDNGQYVCYVPGDSKGLLLNIEGRLPRVTGVKGWDFIVGDVLRLTCSTQYAKDDKVLTWLFEGGPLRSDWWAEEVIRKDDHNVTHHDLSLPVPTRAHVGTYTCTTPFGSVSTVVREIVPPYLEESPPANINVPVGVKLSLPCSVAGYPVPTVIWEKNIDGQWKVVDEMETQGESDVEGIMVNTEPLVEGDKRVGERQELVLEVAYPFHAGKYRCRGYNEEDSVVVETEVVTSAPSPTVLEMKADEVMEGEDLKITCSVSDWEEPVEFIHGLRVLGQDGDEKYETHLISKEEREVEKEGKGGRTYKTKQKIFTHALIISGVTLDDQGFYECQAGVDALGSVEVTVKQLPPKVIEVAASPAVEGEEFFVSCTISNMPTDQEAIFYFAGRNMNKEKDPRYSTHLAELTDEVVINSMGRAKQATYVLKVASAIQEDSGIYHCVVGSDARGSVSVDVEAKEDVEEVFLEASSAWAGGDLVLKCRVTNWNKDVTILLNQTMLLGEEDSRFYLSRKKEGNSTVHTLKIFSVTSQDSGLYQCFTSPLTSAEVNVTVRDLTRLNVVLEQDPKRTPLWINTPLVLDCRVKGFKPYRHTIEFSHNGLPYLYLDPAIKGAQVNQRASLVENKEEDGGLSLEENELSYRMKLDGVMEGDGGTWFCRATIPEAGFADEAFVRIDVYEPPRFTESPDSEISVEYGAELILSCIASGFPVPKVTWFKEGVQEPLVNHTEFARLVITDFSENDTGVYVCEANSLDQFISSETRLDIMKELQIIEMPEQEFEVIEGSPSELRCMALSSPPLESPLVTWIRKDTYDVLASGYEIASYTIDSPTAEDAGEYMCRATVIDMEKAASTHVIVTPRKTMSHTATPSTTLAPTLVSGRLVEISGPGTVEEGEDLTLMCLVSPLLSFYKYLIIFNGTILTFDEQVVRHDPRISVTFGTGGVGERLVRLTIGNVSPFDEGIYECTVNTSPIARNSHFVAVVPEGSLTTATTHHRTEVSPSRETYVTPELWSSLNISDFLDITDPFAFPEPETKTVTDHTESSPESSTYFFIPSSTYDYEEASAKYVRKTVLSGKSVTLPCTIPGNKESPIIWRLKKDLFLISVDLLKLGNNNRFEIDAPDDYTRNLVIHNATIKDAGVYTCLKEITPQVKMHFELTVLKSAHKVSEGEKKAESPAVVAREEEDEEDDGERTEVQEEVRGEKSESEGDLELSLVTEESISHEEEKKMEEELAIGSSEHEEEQEEGSYSEEDSSREEEDTEEMGETKKTEAEQEVAEDPKKGLDVPLLNVTEETSAAPTPSTEEEAGEVEETDEDKTLELEVTDHPPIDSTDGVVVDSEDKGKPDDEEEIGTKKVEDLSATEQPDDSTVTSEIDEGYGEAETADPIHASEENWYDVSEPDIADGGEEAESPYDQEETDSPHVEKDDLYGMTKTDAPESVEATDTPGYMEETDSSFSTEGPDISDSVTEVGTVTPKEHFEEEERDADQEEKKSEGLNDVDETKRTFGMEELEDSEERKANETSEDISVTPSTSGGDVGEESTTAATKIYPDIEEPKEEIQKHREENETYIFTLEEEGEEEEEEEREEERKKIDEGKESESEDDDDEVGGEYDGTGYDYTYSYYDVITTSTGAPVLDHPVIIAKPGEDVQAPSEAEVILPCPTDAVAEDITWKDTETLLFLGSLDLAGVEGLALSPEGELRLLAGISETKDQKTYTCFVYSYTTHDDIPVMSYWIELGQGVTAKGAEHEKDDHLPKGTTRHPTSTFEFPGLEWQEVAVISNSQVSGTSLTDVLKEGGLNAVLVSDSSCGSSDEIKGWDEANRALKECEEDARTSALIRNLQSVFIIIDFTVSLGHHKTYGSTLISVHNVAGNLTAHVFGPLVPLSMENGYTVVECGSPVYPSQKLLDLSAFCKSSVASSILTLQEAYVTHSRKMPMY